jgi:hypothetical protein
MYEIWVLQSFDGSERKLAAGPFDSLKYARAYANWLTNRAQARGVNVHYVVRPEQPIAEIGDGTAELRQLPLPLLFAQTVEHAASADQPGAAADPPDDQQAPPSTPQQPSKVLHFQKVPQWMLETPAARRDLEALAIAQRFLDNHPELVERLKGTARDKDGSPRVSTR